MGASEERFGRIVWPGILLNLCFAMPAVFAADTMLAGRGLPLGTSVPWLQNVGLLLLSLCIFYGPSAVAPARHPTHTNPVVPPRLIASVFWFILLRQSVCLESSGRCCSQTVRLRKLQLNLVFPGDMFASG